MNADEIVSALDEADLFLRDRVSSVPAILNDYDIEILLSIASTCDKAVNIIKQLKSRAEKAEAELKNAEVHADCMEARALAYKDELAKAEARAEALLDDLKIGWLCRACKKRVKGSEWSFCPNYIHKEGVENTATCINFEWRGVQETGERETNER